MFVQNHVKCTTFLISVSVSICFTFHISIILFTLLSLFFFLNRLEQFNDVLSQENALNVGSEFPLFDVAALQLVESKGSIPLEASSVSQTIDLSRET